MLLVGDSDKDVTPFDQDKATLVKMLDTSPAAQVLSSISESEYKQVQ